MFVLLQQKNLLVVADKSGYLFCSFAVSQRFISSNPALFIVNRSCPFFCLSLTSLCLCAPQLGCFDCAMCTEEKEYHPLTENHATK